MTDYTVLANAIKTTFQADAWIGNFANVITIETFKRGFSIQDEKDAQYFAPADLPAIAIVPNTQPKLHTQETVVRKENTVFCEVVAVTRHRAPQAGTASHQILIRNIERVMDKQKNAANDLGIGAFVVQTATTQRQVKKGNYYYLISTTTVQVEL